MSRADANGASVHAPPPGLCGSCIHCRPVTSRGGSRFFLCRLSAVDPAFPRYPRIPVLRCRGYEPDSVQPSGPEARP
jgi:hypothetical protein